METNTKVSTVTDKMRHYRERLRRQGLRPVQVWVPDCRAPAFRSALKRQVTKLDQADEAEALAIVDAVAADVFDER